MIAAKNCCVILRYASQLGTNLQTTMQPTGLIALDP
jgi:hypothetical protein